MAFAIEFERAAARELDDLGHEASKAYLTALPSSSGIARRSSGNRRGAKGIKARRVLEYRVGDYRAIARIEGSAVRIFVVPIGNRRDVYR
jgi:mRNA interferase RelE/StbE